MRLLTIILAIALTLPLLLLACDDNDSCDDGDKIKYKVTLNATWSAYSHPTDFPDDPHFSGLIGTTHNSSIELWQEGQLASPGIQNMAEKGKKSPLDGEIDAFIDDGSALCKLSGDGIGTSPGCVSLTFAIDEDHPLVSLVTMIAPSPDWFVGVSSLSLFENGTWVESKALDLYPYDAGTDSGTTYTSENEVTDPAVNIYEIETAPFIKDSGVQPLGTFTFVKQ